jgi:hypothetical protein
LHCERLSEAPDFDTGLTVNKRRCPIHGQNSAQLDFDAVAEEAVSFKKIVEVIGPRLKIPVISKSPEEATEHFRPVRHVCRHSMVRL